MDFATEGRSASVGEGLAFSFDTGGGDLVKKLKRELCFAMLTVFFAERVKGEHKSYAAVLSKHLLAKKKATRGARACSSRENCVEVRDASRPIRDEYAPTRK